MIFSLRTFLIIRWFQNLCSTQPKLTRFCIVHTRKRRSCRIRKRKKNLQLMESKENQLTFTKRSNRSRSNRMTKEKSTQDQDSKLDLTGSFILTLRQFTLKISSMWDKRRSHKQLRWPRNITLIISKAITKRLRRTRKTRTSQIKASRRRLRDRRQERLKSTRRFRTRMFKSSITIC